jgi:hypothetical protein
MHHHHYIIDLAMASVPLAQLQSDADITLQV